ncbi:pyrroline-5-carboxylate reductase [Talaromyces proteolyticus]|uniref:Pyrroline-5-carboxylate reductase n=1 Tax=Talaromyces proteolyticus TaxID=1131652 RepID=A0AAD4Q6K9_9EURO|nr:pyrroline-5-carboxylate reductase [Talaromyces proteolyticus]KAH8705748.1 pyrroline-5-carboxylate reductase [Talaromyces proteolyticus]
MTAQPSTTASGEKTLAMLGCGNLGLAILTGILSSLSEPSQTEETSFKPPTKFIACVRSDRSAKRIQTAVKPYPGGSVTILQNENIKAVEQANVIILGCKPYMVKEVLAVPGMREALRGKLLISVLAGVEGRQIEEALYQGESVPVSERCTVVRAMPNTAAMVRESMTTIGVSVPPLPKEWDDLISWIFTRIGKIVRLPLAQMDVCTALAGSGPAFAALMLEGLADGAVAMGLPRAEAQFMACQVLKGTVSMVENGEHPAIVKEKISSPGGCTIGGLLVLEDAAVRGTIARSVREATCVASELGKGTQRVNGTRR